MTRYPPAIVFLSVALLPLAAWGCGTKSETASHWNELNAAGEEAYGDGDLAKARHAFEQALTEADKQHLAIERASTLNDLGLVYRAEKDYEKSEGALKEALALREKHLGAADCTGVTLDNLAELYFDQGRLELAESTYLQSLKIAEHAGTDALHEATVLNNLGAFYFAQKKFDQAEPYLQRALDGYTKIREAEKPTDKGAILMLALAEANGDRRDTPAEARIKDLIQALLAIYQMDHRYTQFRELYVRFVRERAGFAPEQALRAAHSFALQADKLAADGKRDDAEAMYNRSLAAFEAGGATQSADAVATRRKYTAWVGSSAAKAPAK